MTASAAGLGSIARLRCLNRFNGNGEVLFRADQARAKNPAHQRTFTDGTKCEIAPGTPTRQRVNS
jgi:hypothetical protein